MKQTFKLLLIMLALQLCPTVGFSYDGQTFTYNVKVTDSIKVKWVKMTFMVISETNKTAQIGSGRYNTSCIDNTTVGDVVIPTTVNGYNIIAINSYAFYNCSKLKTIETPKTISNIGRYAFEGCTNLNSFSIPDGVPTIDYYTFSECQAMTFIDIPQSVTKIGDGAFMGCKNLTHADIPNDSKLNEIGYEAFYNCEKLQSFNIPKTVTSIGDRAFENCKSLISVDIPSAITVLRCFMGCTNLITVNIPNDSKLEKIGSDCFADCEQLLSFNIPQTVTTIGGNAFLNCLNLVSINIPQHVTKIEVCTFMNCKQLKSIFIPENIEEIHTLAFAGCSNLEAIAFHKDCKLVLAANCLGGCDKLTSLVIPKGVRFTSSMVQPIEGDRNKSCNISSITFLEGRDSIPEQAFDYFFKNLSYVKLPKSLKYIGSQAFNNCRNLKNIEIPDSVISINWSAFAYTGLEHIKIPDHVVSIGSQAFNNCFSLDSIEISPSSKLTEIQTAAFSSQGRSPYRHLTLPKGLKKMESRAFYNSSNLETITSFIEDPFTLDSTVFYCRTKNNYEMVTLFVPSKSIDLYRKTEGWNNFKNIVPFSKIIKVENEEGDDYTGRVSIVWHDEQGHQLCVGKCLIGVEEGRKAYYSIILGDELGRVYREVKMQPVIADLGTTTCQLKQIEKVKMCGTVINRGKATANAIVKVRQWLNGKYEYVDSVQTNVQGFFSILVYNDSSEIIVSCDGFMNNHIVRNKFDDGADLGEIVLESEKVLMLDFTYQTTVRDDILPTIQHFYSDVQNISYTIFNDTKQTKIEDTSVQLNGNIVIADGVEAGDQLTITAISLNNRFADANVRIIIDDSDTTHVEMPLVELGGIYVEYESKTDDQLLALIYNASGKLASRATFSSDIVTFTGLEEGSYSMVTLGYDGSFASISDLSGLSAVGLEEGVDYTLSYVTVRNGILSTIIVEDVPEWESAKFSYTTGNTSYLPNKNQMTYGGYVTMAARVDFREQFKKDVEDVKLVINIPKGCDLIDNCVVIDNKLVPYTLNGNILTIQVPKDVMDTRIRFCFKPNMYGTFTSTAYAEFNCHGEHTQSIGTAVFDVEGASISVPNKTNTSKIHISGIALPKAEIDVYDNDHLIGSTQALADGSWKMDCELYKPYNLSTHEIYAKIKATNGLTAVTESQNCLYNYCVVVKSVDMIFPTLLGELNQTITFDFTTSSVSHNYYSITSGNTFVPFTFVSNLTRNDTVVVKAVTFNVFTSSKTIKQLKGFFDKKIERWVAFDNFSMSALPVNLSLKVDEVEAEQLTDRNEIDDKLNEQEESLIEAKGELADLDAIFDKVDNEDGEPSAYEKLLSLLEKGTYSETEYHALIDEIQNIPLPSDIETIGEGQLEENYTRLMKEYNDFAIKYCKDSVYAALGINANVRDVEWPTDSYTGDIKNGNENRTYSIEHLTSIDEAKLLAQGFSIIPATDGSKLYCLENETEVIYIDGKTNTKYSFAIVKEANGKRRINMDFQTIMSLNPQYAPFIMLRDFVTELVNQDGYNQEMLQRQIDYINPIIKAVENAYTNYLSWMNSSLLTWYNGYTQTCNIIADGFEVDKVRYANEFKELTSSIVGTPNMEEARRMAELIIREQTCERSANICKSNLAKVNAVYERVRGWIKQLPEVPSVRVGRGLKLTGQLALGGFGLFIELSDMYSDLRNARDNYIGWIDLLNEVDRIIPCPKNPETALELQRQVRSDARDLVHNYDRIFTAEIQAMEMDVVSLVSAIGGLVSGPGAAVGETAALALDFASGIYGIYSEASKSLSINGKFRNHEANYWTRLLNIKCKKDKDSEPDENPVEQDLNPFQEPDLFNVDFASIINPSFRYVVPMLDPSGYVYEAVPSNRVEGVTASIYYDENNPQLWDAADYSQINPQITDETGLYAWDVPQGMWQVRFEKEGYETTQTEWLPVPPPQLEINIPMSQAIAPEVTKARGAESGIWLTFSKYMKPETLTKNGRVSVNCNGKTIKGDVEMLDLEEDPYNKHEYASKVKFVPDVAFNTTDEVVITVKKEVESYASMQMEADFVQRVIIEPEIKNISCDSLIVVDYQNAKTIEIAVLPASAAKGKTVHVATTSPMIASVDRSEVTLDDEGKAHVTVSGNLPGGAALLLSLPEAELSVAPQVQVVIHENAVRNPKASKRSGSVVEEGFLLTLTCATVGATIYYTTDGSCPCYEKTRKRYDAPISITSDMTINAIAVREGMEDSEVVTFTYKIGDPSSISTVGNEPIDIEYQNGAFVITGAEGATCNIYDLAGQLVASKQRIARRERMVFSKKGVYVVNVETTDGVTVAKKMVVK